MEFNRYTYKQSKVGVNPPATTKRPEFPIRKRANDTKMVELVKWLQSERYLIDNKSYAMSEEFERKHQWELSKNRMIDKTIQKIVELSFE